MLVRSGAVALILVLVYFYLVYFADTVAIKFNYFLATGIFPFLVAGGIGFLWNKIFFYRREITLISNLRNYFFYGLVGVMPIIFFLLVPYVMETPEEKANKEYYQSNQDLLRQR